MQIGRTLSELASEVERQSAAKKDFVAHSDQIYLTPEANLQLKDVGEFGVQPNFHSQLSEKLNIPKQYYDRCLAEAPYLLADNVNAWLARSQSKHLVRTLDGAGRAFLSDRYRTLDNSDLLEAVLPALPAGIEVRSCQVTDRRLYLQLSSPRLSGEVKVGDVVEAGLVISNSEVGYGRLSLESLLYRLWCKNGAVTGEGFKKAHLGRKADGITDGVEEYFKDSTRRLSDAALFAQLRDAVAGLLTEAHFARTLDTLKVAASVKITSDPVKVVEVTAKQLQLTDGERGSVLRHLIEGGDLSKWGLANAVTRLAHDADTYDRGVELERLGGRVIELPRSEWEVIEKLAA